MEADPTRVCELLAGLGDVEVLGAGDEEGAPLRVHIPPAGSEAGPWGLRRAAVVRR